MGRGKFYYGWIIVGVGLVSMAFWFGIRSSFSVFYVALLEEYPWSRAESAGVQSVALMVYTVLAPLVGGLIDRFGPRRIILPGIGILFAGLMMCASMRTLSQFYVYYGVVVGTGVTAIGIVSYSAILAHWFERKRGLASGIAVSGMGLGTFLLVPLSQYVISSYGWRMTFMIIGGLAVMILFPLNGFFLKHKPRELGLWPDGWKGPDPTKTGGAETPDVPEAQWTLKKAMHTGPFWALVAFPLLAVIGVYVVLVHNVKFAVDNGIDKMTAASIFALAGAVSSVFRIFWGWLSDRIGREVTYTMGMICICAGVLFLLMLERPGGEVFLYPFFFFFGMGWGVTAPMFMATAADLFKGGTFGLIYGIVEGAIGMGAALGTWAAGAIFDRTGSYAWAFGLAMAAFLLSCLCMWVAAPRRLHPRSNDLRAYPRKRKTTKSPFSNGGRG
ncbi:MAG: MFS transporter [Deltaproteobacteria bacterium]|nr:MFS transporter [Deltaproteobacteria bacterium]